MADRKRKDLYMPPEPAEALRFLFQVSLQQAREGGDIEVYLPPAQEQAEQLVDRASPLQITTLTEFDAEV